MNQQRKSVYALRKQILEGRYAPELTEEEIKAGKEPIIPTESGDWTIPQLSEKLKPVIDRQVERFLNPPQPPAPTPPEAPPEPPPKKTWRELRHEIWRQYGALVDVEKVFEKGDRPAMIDLIVATVAASLIQQRERIYDLADQLIGEAVDEACPPNTHLDDWDLHRRPAHPHDNFHIQLHPP